MKVDRRPSSERPRELEPTSGFFEIGTKTDSNTPATLDPFEIKKQQEVKKQRAEEETLKKESTKKVEGQKKVEKKLEKKKKIEESTEEKQERRTQLVEQSLFYKKLYEEKPIPRDPVILARLLIADHILAIHSQIEQPDPDASVDKAQLLHSLDYMGELAHKFENPDEESTPEIQEAYEMILLRTGEALQSTDTVDGIIDVNEDTAHLPITKEKVSPTAEVQGKVKTSLSLPATILISTLLRARKKATEISTDTLSHPTADSGGGGGVASSSATATTTTHPEASRPLDSHNHTPSSPIKARAAYHEAIRNNHNTSPSLRSPERIAALAVGAALSASHETRPQSTVRPYDSPPIHDHSPQTAARESISHSTPHFESHHSPSSPVSHTEHMPSSHELEHLPLHSLLTMAETISIGHGQRLRSAYEHGQIDKEGLIKILKSRVKNKDFLQEYKQQVTHRRNLIQSSPEFLKSTPRKDSTDQTIISETQEYDKAPAKKVTPAPEKPKLPFLDTPPHNPTIDASLERLKQQAENTPTGWRRILIIAGVGAVLIATIIYFIAR